jgi:hypothetical protein
MNPLLNHPAPQSQETLKSWLWRLALTNYLDSPRPLLKILEQRLSGVVLNWQQVNICIRERQVFEALAELTRTSARTVYDHTLHRFAHVLTPPTRTLDWLYLSGDVSVALLPAKLYRDFHLPGPRWCPVCLTETRSVRLHWHIPTVTCCVRHGCWLQEGCPFCGVTVSEEDLVLGQCMTCARSFNRVRPVSMQADDALFVWQKTLMAWLYQIEPSTMGLPSVPVNTQLAVLRGLRYAAQRAGNDWKFHVRPTSVPTSDLYILKQRRLTVHESGSLYATAFRGLHNWPHGFNAFLDAYRQRPEQMEPTGLRREFGTLHISWLSRFWKHSAFAFIQKAFNEYLLAHIPVSQFIYSHRAQDFPELLEDVDYLDLNGARLHLKISTWSVYRLVDEGHLTTYQFEDNMNGIWFSREHLDELLDRWQQHLPFLHVVDQLAISKRLVKELLDAQLLQTIPASAGWKRTGVYIYKASLNAFLERLRTQTTIQPQLLAEYMLLRDVCILHGGSVQLNLVELLQRVLNGQLTAYHTSKTLLPLGEMGFLTNDIAPLATTVKSERHWLGKEEVRSYLGISVPQLHQLIDCNLLVPQRQFGRKQFFSESNVGSVAKRFVFMREARERLKIAYISIARLIQHGILHALSYPVCPGRRCYIFDREAFDEWQKQYILLPEMTQETGDLETLLSNLRAASIQPIVTAPVVYYRKEVMSYLHQ